MEVGIREFRNNLAAILDEVDKGTVVTITHHGKPRATIQPVLARDESPVERGIREGWLTVGPGYYRKRRNREPLVTIGGAQGKAVLEALREDREDDR
jgi:prevent-host-death family protein